MPLVNNLVIRAYVPPTVVDIHDWTDHMAAGSKKDAKYVDGVMEEEIVKFDPERMQTNVFFYGAAHVQKGGLRVCVLYPRAYVSNVGYHVISPFF